MSLEREFIPYEQALALKELGFNKPCLSRYCRVTEWEVTTGKILFQLSDCELNEKNLIKAPTLSQAFRFFRKKYGICSWVYQVEDNRYFFSQLKNGRYLVNKRSEYDTYEEAELECLKKLIEIVKESKDGNN
jgi:hypothetical protein